MKSFKKQFLFRRRFDAWALGVAAASMPVRIGLGPLILFVFSCLGIYISSARHSVARLFCKKFYIFILLYAAWSLGLILYRHEPFHENRQIGYTLLVAIFAFGGPGMALIRDPLKAYVLGSRVGIILAAVVAVFLAMTAGGRIGVGGNQAVFAFLAGVTAVSASIPVRAAPRWLPNGPHWLVLGLAAILPSETRAVIVVIPFFAVVEIILFMRRFNIRQQGAVYAALIAALVALARDVADEFFKDVDHSLRELGIGDQGVPKRMKKLARMFYGRVTAYGTALDAGDGPALAAALTRNIRPDLESWPYAGLLGAYVFYCRDRLRDTADEALAAGEISFMDAEAIQPVGDEKADDHE